MNKVQSIYLDLMRFIAALAVFLAHVPMFIGGYLWQFGQLGHQAVVIFFVLSGFVIAFVTDTKEKLFSDYILNRVSRIYSVAIPALLLSFVIYVWGIEQRPEVFSAFSSKMLDPWFTFFTALTFTNQSWVNVTVFANPPYWSLGYEVLYYALFGVIHFYTGLKRILLASFIIILMGPSIIIYIPVWWLGVFTYHQCKKQRPNQNQSSNIGFIISLLVIGLLIIKPTIDFFDMLTLKIFSEAFISHLIPPAENFLADYCLALALALNIYLIKNGGRYLSWFLFKFEKSIRMSAKHTFSLYLFHFPILCFYAVVFPFETNSFLAVVGTLIFAPISILVLGLITEDKRVAFRDLIKKFTHKNRTASD